MIKNNARLSRRALWLIILLYLLPGLFGRAPWKPDDSIGFGTAYGLMNAPFSNWATTSVGDQLFPAEGIIGSWLYAVIGMLANMLHAPHEWLDDFMRLGNLLWLILAGWAIWNATYYLARRSELQPEDPFGIAPSRIDYARAVADASVLCLMGTLGLLIRSHYQVSDLPLLAGISLIFLAAVRALDRPLGAGWLLGVGAAIAFLARGWAHALPFVIFLLISSSTHGSLRFCLDKRLLRALTVFGSVVLAWFVWISKTEDGLIWWNEWQRWNLNQFIVFNPKEAFGIEEFTTTVKTFAWFLWPILPMAGWTLYQYRHQLNEPGIRLVVGAVFAGLLSTIITNPTEEPSFVVAVPPLCAMAAVGLSSMRRGLIGFIDWFAVLCFTGIAIVVWLGWSAVLFGWPEKTAANIEKLSPGFIPQTPGIELPIALLASAVWVWLIVWRTRSNTSKKGALWRPMILSSGGITLIWLLIMTLFVGRLDFAKSYYRPSLEIRNIISATSTEKAGASNPCVADYNLEASQRAPIEYHLRLPMFSLQKSPACGYVLLTTDERDDYAQAREFTMAHSADGEWKEIWRGRRSSDRRDWLILYQRVTLAAQ